MMGKEGTTPHDVRGQRVTTTTTTTTTTTITITITNTTTYHQHHHLHPTLPVTGRSIVDTAPCSVFFVCGTPAPVCSRLADTLPTAVGKPSRGPRAPRESL
ncbi:hypothetical protein PMIN07_008669 [Paraphaeosphaeria minitans]